MAHRGAAAGRGPPAGGGEGTLRIGELSAPGEVMGETGLLQVLPRPPATGYWLCFLETCPVPHRAAASLRGVQAQGRWVGAQEPATLTALTRCELLVLPKPDFRK